MNHSRVLLFFIVLLISGIVFSLSAFAAGEKGPIEAGIDSAIENATDTSPAGIGDKIVGIFVPGVGPVGAGLSTACKEASAGAAEACLEAADDCWTGGGAWPALTPVMILGAGLSRVGQGLGIACECICEPVTSVVSLSTTIVDKISGPPTGGPGGPVTPGGGPAPPRGPITGGPGRGPVTPGGPPGGGGASLCASMPVLSDAEIKEIAKDMGIESTSMANYLRCKSAVCPASDNPETCNAAPGQCLGSVGGAGGVLTFSCFCQWPACTPGPGPGGPVVTPGTGPSGPSTGGPGTGPTTPGGGPSSPVACGSKTVKSAGSYLATINTDPSAMAAAGLTNPDGSLNLDAIYDAQCATNTFCPEEGDSCAWAGHQFCHCEGGSCGPGTGPTPGGGGNPDDGSDGGACTTDDGNPSPGTTTPEPGCKFPVFDDGFFFCVDNTPDDPSTPGGGGCQYPVEGDYWINFWVDGDIIPKKNWVCADLQVVGKTPNEGEGNAPQPTACVDKPNTPLSQVSIDMQYPGIIYKEDPWNETTYYGIYVCGYECGVVQSTTLNGEPSLACTDLVEIPDDGDNTTPSTCDYPDFTYNNECYDVVPQFTLSLPNCSTVVYAPNGGGVYCAEGHASNFVSRITDHDSGSGIEPFYYSEDYTVQFIEASGNVVGLPYCNDLAVTTHDGYNVCVDAKALDHCLVPSGDGIGCDRVGIAITSSPLCDVQGGLNTLNAYGENGCYFDDPSILGNTYADTGNQYGWFCDADNVCVWIEPQEDQTNNGDDTDNTNPDDGTTSSCTPNDGVADPAGQCSCPATNPGSGCSYPPSSTGNVICTGNGLPSDGCMYDGMNCPAPDSLYNGTCYDGSFNANDITCSGDEYKLIGASNSWYCIDKDEYLPTCQYKAENVFPGGVFCVDDYAGYDFCQVVGTDNHTCYDPECLPNGCYVPDPYAGCAYPTITATGAPACYDESSACENYLCPPPSNQSGDSDETQGSIFDQIGDGLSQAGEGFSNWLNQTFG